MKAKIQITAILSAFFILPSAFGQGALTPPGPPAPTMKTLDQIEPRMPIASASFTITQPGSYYLTTNLVVGSGLDGVDINTNGVTLDLNGFSIIAGTNSSPYGPPYSGIGLLAGTLNDITICNGHIVGNVTNNAGVFNGNGFYNGIIYYGVTSPSPGNVRVSSVTVSGCLYQGIYVGFGSSGVESCNVQNVGAYGIYAANVSHCAAVQCGQIGISAEVVSSSVGATLGSGDGIDALYNAQNCYGSSNGGYGMYTAEAESCHGTSSSGTGLYAANTAVNCYGSSSSGTGLYAFIGNSCYGTSTTGTAESVPNKYNMP